ncbi:hypothetical protein Y032_0094g2763 [Ancylostoma ceylanicum]|uniref:Uncharacterized protein n=1 Tax=Ancylostoma ceylanicum TaxID=53326 RepID=A0A016TLJ7_9BILA|nr:hypothetical protein Y032_0094g2763 [Ancylostoma ceylanicum]
MNYVRKPATRNEGKPSREWMVYREFLNFSADDIIPFISGDHFLLYGQVAEFLRRELGKLRTEEQEKRRLQVVMFDSFFLAA